MAEPYLGRLSDLVDELSLGERALFDLECRHGFDLHDESVHLVAGSAFRVRVFEDGRLAEIYGVARDEREVSGADVAVYRDFIQEYYPGSQQDDYLSALAHPIRPTVLPAYSRLLSATDGHVWAQIYSPDVLAPATWDVFNGVREWVGQVQTPASFILMSITDGKVAGVWSRRSRGGARASLSNSSGLSVERVPCPSRNIRPRAS